MATKAATNGKHSVDRTSAAANGKHVEAPSAGARASAELPLRVDFITPSPLNPRKTFDEVELQQLADSVKSLGVIQPVLVRPTYFFGNPKIKRTNGAITPDTFWEGGPTIWPTMVYELVDGERRFRAAKLAGLEEIPAKVRDLSDKEVLEIALVTTEQRKDVNDLEKARGYKQLIDEHGYTAGDLAAKIGKPATHVYALLKALLAPPEAVEAFDQGRISLNHLVLIGRIPSEALRKKATHKILHPDYLDEPLSFRTAKARIEEDFTVELKGAPFDRKSLKVLPEAGSCEECPKRTGNNRAEYPDGRADVCTDPECYRKKVAAFRKAQVERAEAKGQQVLSAKEAKQALRDAAYSEEQWVDLDRSAYVNGVHLKYSQAIGEQVKDKVILAVDENGKAHRLVPADVARPLLGKKKPGDVTDWQEEQRREREHKNAWRLGILTRIGSTLREKSRLVSGLGWLEEILAGVCREKLDEEVDASTLESLALGVNVRTLEGPEDPAVREKILAAAAEYSYLPLILLQWAEDHLPPWNLEERAKVVCQLFGLDAKAIKKEVEQELKEKAKQAKAAAKEQARQAKRAQDAQVVEALRDSGVHDCADASAQSEERHAIPAASYGVTWDELERASSIIGAEWHKAKKKAVGAQPFQCLGRKWVVSGVTYPGARSDNGKRSPAEFDCLPLYPQAEFRAKHKSSGAYVPRFYRERGYNPDDDKTGDGGYFGTLVNVRGELFVIGSEKEQRVLTASDPDDKPRRKAAAADPAGEDGDAADRCRVCQCTEEKQCKGGCYRVETGLCSACVALGADPISEEGQEAVPAIRRAAESRKLAGVK